MPVRKRTKERKQKLKPWITQTIIAKIKTKDKLYKKLIKIKNRDTPMQFNKIKNEVTAFTCNSKEKYYKNYFNKPNINLKKVWSGVKEIINISKKSLTLPSSLTDKNRILNDQKEIPDHFNSYLHGIAENIRNNRKHRGTHSYKEYLKNPLLNSHIFFDCDITISQCLILLLQISRSSGPYSIPVNAIHMLKKDISIPLSKISHIHENWTAF